jgi:hypothetical protein
VLVFVGLVVSVISSLGAPLIPTIARSLHTLVVGDFNVDAIRGLDRVTALEMDP